MGCLCTWLALPVSWVDLPSDAIAHTTQTAQDICRQMGRQGRAAARTPRTGLGVTLEVVPHTNDLSTFGWGYDGSMANSTNGLAMTVLALSILEHHDRKEQMDTEDGGSAAEEKAPETDKDGHKHSANLVYQLGNIRTKHPVW